MSVTSKLRMIPTILVVAVLGVAAIAIVPAVKQRVRDKPVSVAISFTPENRSGKTVPGGTFPDIVSIELIVGGGAGNKHRATQSPWVQLLYPGKGQVISVTASQVHGAQIGCAITQDGQSAQSQIKSGPAQVVCKLVSL